MSDKTYFGFREIDSKDKASLVHDVFVNVSSKYDLMNDMMSGGLHRLWKNQMITMLAPRNHSKLLDIAGGTGDIAIRYLRACSHGNAYICDVNKSMLEEGKNNAIDHGILDNLFWQCGRAETLPFPDHHFDYCTIAFGIRNVTYIEKALQEAFRILKPGGRFLCLEFSKIQSLPALSRLYDLYSFHIIPKMGKIMTGQSDAYQYLVESIRKFPDQETFADLMKKQGFSNVRYRNMTFGIVALHSGWKV